MDATADDFLSPKSEKKLIVTNTDLYIWHDIQVLGRAKYCPKALFYTLLYRNIST